MSGFPFRLILQLLFKSKKCHEREGEKFWPLIKWFRESLLPSSLQIQRNLQLRIEEQGKYLQMMFEKQRKMESEGSKASSSAVNDDTSPKALQSASGNEKAEAPDQNSPRAEVDPNPFLDGKSSGVSGKHKMPEMRTVKEDGPSSPKRAKEDKSD